MAFIDGENGENFMTILGFPQYGRKIDDPVILAAKLSSNKADGHKDAEKNLWKDAQGDDLPDYDREVVVLIQDYPDDEEHLRVAFGHRPKPDGYTTKDGERIYAMTYDKGGWNGKNIRYWLDLKLPMHMNALTTWQCGGEAESDEGVINGPDQLEPIPLTTEILEKNGHKECTNGDWTNDNVDFILHKRKDGVFRIQNTNMTLPWVSCLQHALRLCGIDKEIEL